jgi:hypothetical protein
MTPVTCCKCFKASRRFVCRCGHRICTSCWPKPTRRDYFVFIGAVASFAIAHFLGA